MALTEPKRTLAVTVILSGLSPYLAKIGVLGWLLLFLSSHSAVLLLLLHSLLLLL